MKNKIISIMILITLIAPLLSCYNAVQAYSGEIDPQNYITLPSTIWIENKVGTGTISLSSSASGYTLSYQKVDITKATLDSIDAKLTETNQYIETSNTEIKNKETNLKTLQDEYKELQNSGTATQEELTAAENKYNEAYEEYETYVNTAKERAKTLQTEYYALIPNYTNSWQTTTNTSNNVKLDFKDYTGTAHFILWAKIENGTNTYYDFMGYSSEIKEEQKQPIDENPTEEPSGDWTDFSSAKYELVKEGISGALVEISGVNYKEDSLYYLYITSSNNKPDITSLASSEKITLTYNKEKNKLMSVSTDKVAGKVELNQDLYATIVEYNSKGKESIVTYGNKLTRYAEAKYNDAFWATFMTNDADQIITNFTHAEENNRKIEVKIGKITDTSILNKLKKQDSTGFSELLKFAKSSTSIYDKTLNADKDDSYAIEYNAGTGTSKGNSVIDLKGLQNDGYYYLYIKTDDENGKYISNEAVTLAQARIHDNGWGLFFYGSSDFKWADFGNIAESGDDDSIAPGKLPHAGSETIKCIGIGIIVVGVGAIFYSKYKKYQGI